MIRCKVYTSEGGGNVWSPCMLLLKSIGWLLNLAGYRCREEVQDPFPVERWRLIERLGLSKSIEPTYVTVLPDYVIDVYDRSRILLFWLKCSFDKLTEAYFKCHDNTCFRTKMLIVSYSKKRGQIQAFKNLLHLDDTFGIVHMPPSRCRAEGMSRDTHVG